MKCSEAFKCPECFALVRIAGNPESDDSALHDCALWKEHLKTHIIKELRAAYASNHQARGSDGATNDGTALPPRPASNNDAYVSAGLLIDFFAECAESGLQHSGVRLLRQRTADHTRSQQPYLSWTQREASSFLSTAGNFSGKAGGAFQPSNSSLSHKISRVRSYSNPKNSAKVPVRKAGRPGPAGAPFKGRRLAAEAPSVPMHNRLGSQSKFSPPRFRFSSLLAELGNRENAAALLERTRSDFGPMPWDHVVQIALLERAESLRNGQSQRDRV